MGKRARNHAKYPRAQKIAADLHERETQVAVFEKEGTLLQERRLPTKDLRKFVSSLPGKKHVGVESVGFIYPIYDDLRQIPDCEVFVCNPRSIREKARAKIKHDRVDARILGDSLRANYFPKSYMPADEETREKRFLMKERVMYGVKLANLKTSMKWMLKRRGLVVNKPLSAEGREQLRSLHLIEIDNRLRELELLESIIEELDDKIRVVVSRYPNANLVDTIPGLAAYTALFLSSALDDVDRFEDSKQACGYLGLVPSLDQTGDVAHYGHITKLGNKWLRRNLVECAQVAVRKDPHLKEFFLRIAYKRGKKKAYVAVARKLVAYAYWALKRNQTYQELDPWNLTRGASSGSE